MRRETIQVQNYRGSEREMCITVMSLRGREEEPERTIVCWREERIARTSKEMNNWVKIREMDSETSRSCKTWLLSGELLRWWSVNVRERSCGKLGS